MTEKQNQSKEEIKTIPWTSEWEVRYQYVSRKFDYVRGMGIDLLKLYLTGVIALILVPTIFHEKVLALFEKGMVCIYLSWIYLLISIFTGLLTYYLVVKGYNYQAQKEEYRLLPQNLSSEEVSQKIKKYNVKEIDCFNWADRLGFWTACFFGTAILCLVIAIYIVILKK